MLVPRCTVKHGQLGEEFEVNIRGGSLLLHLLKLVHLSFVLLQVLMKTSNLPGCVIDCPLALWISPEDPGVPDFVVSLRRFVQNYQQVALGDHCPLPAN
jgi:hypothetical protein